MQRVAAGQPGVAPPLGARGRNRDVVLSVTEGVDNPLEYPVMFREADLVMLSKIELLLHLPGVYSALPDNLARVLPATEMIALSAVTGEGVRALIDWVSKRRGRLPVERSARATF